MSKHYIIIKQILILMSENEIAFAELLLSAMQLERKVQKLQVANTSYENQIQTYRKQMQSLRLQIKQLQNPYSVNSNKTNSRDVYNKSLSAQRTQENKCDCRSQILQLRQIIRKSNDLLYEYQQKIAQLKLNLIYSDRISGELQIVTFSNKHLEQQLSAERINSGKLKQQIVDKELEIAKKNQQIENLFDRKRLEGNMKFQEQREIFYQEIEKSNYRFRNIAEKKNKNQVDFTQLIQNMEQQRINYLKLIEANFEAYKQLEQCFANLDGNLNDCFVNLRQLVGKINQRSPEIGEEFMLYIDSFRTQFKNQMKKVFQRP